MEPEYAGRSGGASQPDFGCLPHPAEFRADRHDQFGQAPDARDRGGLPTLAEPVSGRSYRGRQRPDFYSALSSAAGGFGIPARRGCRLYPACGHQTPGQRLRVYLASNSHYLRGWNKYDIDPIGGNRLLHNTVEYRYGPFQAFYDAGAVWDSGQPATPRHSVGVGFKESIFSLAVAFPVKSGHVEPVVMIGIIY